VETLCNYTILLASAPWKQFEMWLIGVTLTTRLLLRCLWVASCFSVKTSLRVKSFLHDNVFHHPNFHFHANQTNWTRSETEAKSNSKMACSVSPHTLHNNVFLFCFPFLFNIQIIRNHFAILKSMETRHSTFRCWGLVPRFISPANLLLFHFWR